MKQLPAFEKRILGFALLVHLIAAWFSIGFHHPDEHFQIIEFANYKLGRTPLDKLAWEFPAHMRPGLQPFMAYILLKPYYALGFDNPFHFAFLLRLISGLVSIFTAWQFHKAIVPQIRSEYLKKTHLILSVLGWGLVYLHVRFSSETWAAISFTWALLALWKQNKASYWLFGLWAGLSFIFRFQSCFLLAGAGLWMLFIEKSKWADLGKMVLAFIATFIVGLVFEYWLYDEFTVSGWNYVVENVVYNKAANFGTEPWYWYFGQIVQQSIPPFSIILLLSIPVMILYKPRHILTWSMVAFLLGHMVVAHKEHRFLFPLAFFAPYYVVVTISFFDEKLKSLHNSGLWTRFVYWFRRAFWATNTVALAIMITKPANDIIALNQQLFKNLKQRTFVLYSYEFNPYINGDTCGATFYASPLISSHCIDDFINDTAMLQGKNVWLFSEHAYSRNEFMFQYGGSFFDSNRTKVIYTRLPTWLYPFNFNQWLERSNPYTVYQLFDHRVR